MSGILFDARLARPGGISYYVHHLLQALPANTGDKIGIILPVGSAYGQNLEKFHVFYSRVDLANHPSTDLFEQFAIPFLCYKHGFNHFVSFLGRIPVCHPGIKTYSFVYDLAFLTVKGSQNPKYSFLLSIYLKLTEIFSTYAVTISKAVQIQIADTLKLPLKKIIVVYPADSRLKVHESLPVTTLKKPFFLAAGMTNPRKNLENLLKAFASFNEEGSYQLAITGNFKWVADSCRGTSNVINLGFLKEGELRFLYENTSGLIYPSFDEGFGIPLLDAVQFNRAVICSDIPVFREVMEDSAFYFDPKSPESIVQSLKASLMESRTADYERILKKFSWEESASKFMADIKNG